MVAGNITLSEELLPQLEDLARLENRTPDDVVAEAVQQFLVRRLWQRNKLEAAKRRGDMTDEQVEEYVDRMIHEFRADSQRH